MLPSGNDAGICLAEHFGQYLFEVATRYKNNKANTGQGAGPSGTTNSGPGNVANKDKENGPNG